MKKVWAPWLVACACMLTMPVFADEPPVRATTAQKLERTLGINLHLLSSSHRAPNNSVPDNEDIFFDTILLPRILESGIRYFRDSTGQSPSMIKHFTRRTGELGKNGLQMLAVPHPPMKRQLIPKPGGGNDYKESLDWDGAKLRAENPFDTVNGLYPKLEMMNKGGIFSYANGDKVKIFGGTQYAGIQGLNEYNLVNGAAVSCETPPANDLMQPSWYRRLSACRPQWFEELTSYTQGLVDNKKLPQFQSLLHVPVMASPLVEGQDFSSLKITPSETLLDRLTPLYALTSIGSANLYGNRRTHLHSVFPVQLAAYQGIFYPKKLTVSEMGYYTEGEWSGDLNDVTRIQQSKLLIRSIFEYIATGAVDQVYLYTLLDDCPVNPTLENCPMLRELNPPEDTAKGIINLSVLGYVRRNASYGIVDYAGKPKPAFYTIKHALSLLSEKNPMLFVPSALEMHIDDATGTIRSHLFQKSNGVFYLALWGDPDAPTTDEDLIQKTGLTFGRRQDIQVFRPSKGMSPIDSFVNQREIQIDIPDDLLILEIKTSNLGEPTPTPTPLPTITFTPTPIVTSTATPLVTPTPTSESNIDARDIQTSKLPACLVSMVIEKRFSKAASISIKGNRALYDLKTLRLYRSVHAEKTNIASFQIHKKKARYRILKRLHRNTRVLSATIDNRCELKIIRRKH